MSPRELPPTHSGTGAAWHQLRPFLLNGVAQPAGESLVIPAGQLAQTAFKAGAGTDQLWMRAHDGLERLEVLPGSGSSQHRPQVTVGKVNAAHDQSLAASSLFSVSDGEGDPITYYQYRSDLYRCLARLG